MNASVSIPRLVRLKVWATRALCQPTLRFNSKIGSIKSRCGSDSKVLIINILTKHISIKIAKKIVEVQYCF